MPFNTFIQGIAIGFTLAAAVGPIAILLIQRTLMRGWRTGIASGLGVGLADASFGLLGGLGLAALNQFLVDQQTPMRIIGGIVLAGIGIRIVGARPEQAEMAQTTGRPKTGYLGAAASIYALTLANPMTIFSFAAVYAALDPGAASGAWQGVVFFSLAIFTGSFSWWVVLATVTHRLRERISTRVVQLLNAVSGTAIFFFGAWMVLREFG